MRLLLVEDNEELAQLLTQRLQAAGYETDVLTTAAEAQSAVTTTRYAAMVLDLGLPDGDGLSVLREIRRREDPLPVLVLTARGGLQDRVSGLRSGADDYLVKPFAFEELLARLEALLRRPGQLLGRSLQIANLAFDTESRQAFIDDKPQLLSARETAVRVARVDMHVRCKDDGPPRRQRAGRGNAFAGAFDERAGARKEERNIGSEGSRLRYPIAIGERTE